MYIIVAQCILTIYLYCKEKRAAVKTELSKKTLVVLKEVVRKSCVGQYYYGTFPTEATYHGTYHNRGLRPVVPIASISAIVQHSLVQTQRMNCADKITEGL